ncbi:protein DOUBLE-STRAND BREAK FORMATION-like isoform X2 [Triticum dicoccoides]|uniref:protein DOUBLE-STRAND BREAK FORMATION-like isoform X2 n=1 Tax=Triticum dicoccoides TaxID=85692 RepID=UPI00188F776F|nr:protein DOUBLE-STRAND BREAK FORMATION-like isoform X2 [Triticum dicoccoides]XP_044384851.1 protein DOUBLE-STRAND BREAK FORMATION-like isoform X2 [Triticum aestivum]
MAMEQEGTTAHQRHGGGTITDALSLFASRLSHHRFGDEELRVLEAALSAGGDVAALLSTRSAARKLLRESVAGACAAAAVEGDGARLSVADFFARAFALSGDVESCLAMRYEALVLREAKYSDDLDLHVFHEEWLTFAQDSLDNGFYTIASKAFANALVHIHPSHLDSTNSTLKKNKVNDIRGLQTLAKSLSAQRSDAIRRIHEKENFRH